MQFGNQVVMGIFDNRSQIENCIEQLKMQGFRNSEISLFMLQKTPARGPHRESSGAILSGTLTWLVGADIVLSQRGEAFVVAGPLMALVSGAALGNSEIDLVRILRGLGIPAYLAKRYWALIQLGHVLVSAHVDQWDWCQKADEIFRSSGAMEMIQVSESDEERFNYESPRFSRVDVYPDRRPPSN